MLTESECWDLVRGADIGRLAWTQASGHPVVVPVNFIVDDGDVVFRSAEGEKFAAVLADHLLAFQVDDAEPAVRVGWSVLIQGRGSAVTDQAEVERLCQSLRPWSEGRRHVVRLHPERISGRRLSEHPGRVTTLWIGPTSHEGA
ncbi:MAG TPA: pyridoxamine 5'-phosphate oxidase family protein [Frankiaceae bacterium]|nr:pyridoxamine 5'-phosphate oxidase family protein [Frankiaceae bacterium]